MTGLLLFIVGVLGWHIGVYGLFNKSKIDNIDVGNINDNFDVVSEADWVVEAVVERIDIKHNIYEKILLSPEKSINLLLSFLQKANDNLIFLQILDKLFLH